MRRKKQIRDVKKIKDWNKKLMEEQKKAEKLKGLKSLKTGYEKEWKKLTLEDNTEENLNKKMQLRNRIKQLDEEIKALEK